MKNKIHLFNQIHLSSYPQACIVYTNMQINNFNFEIACYRFSTIRYSVRNERVEKGKGNNKQ